MILLFNFLEKMMFIYPINKSLYNMGSMAHLNSLVTFFLVRNLILKSSLKLQIRSGDHVHNQTLKISA